MTTETKKIKPLFILPALTAGGAERVMITLMNGLDRNRFEPEFLVFNPEGPLKDIIDPAIPFHSLDCRRASRSLPRLYRALRTIKPDIVISTMAHINFIVLLLKPFFPKTKFIVREAVTPDFILKEHAKIAPFLKAAYRHLYKSAHLVISPAHIIIDGFKNDLKMTCDNHIVLPNPVDMDKIRRSEDQKFVVNEVRTRTVQFVSAGRLHHQKGFDALIEALPNLDMPYDWHWTIFGEGPERETLKALIRKHNLQGRISLPGLSNNPWQFFTQADCFLMPSRWEGLPNVILEALACGIPAIATDTSGGIAEIAAVAENNVTVVSNMQDFIAAMAKTKPAPTGKFRLSRLPERFQREKVLDEFSVLLQNTIKN